MDRRTFLGRGAQASAALAVGGAVASGAGAEPGEVAGPAGASVEAGGSPEFTAAGTLRPAELTVGGWINPIGVDADDCSFGWTLQAPGRTVLQKGYRIVVRRVDPGHAGVVWDSGKVKSARQAFVRFGGPALVGDAAYSWTVAVQDALGEWSAPSAAATFTTALRSGDWRAQWLQPAALSPQPDRVTYVRASFQVPAGRVVRATAYLAAAHTAQLYANGSRVDLGPAFCYPDEQYFTAVDLTSVLRPGQANALGVVHRWYGAGQGRPLSYPGLLVQLSLHYANGRHVTFGTGTHWRELAAEWLPSAKRNTDGADWVEWVDGRRHPQGWSDPGYDDVAWTAPKVMGHAPVAPFTGMYVQRTRVADHVVEPVSLRTLSDGSVVADLGAVYAARLRVQFRAGLAGRSVGMRVGYLLDPDGQVSTIHGTQGTNLSFSYVQRAGDQVYEALTYLGFRYVQIDDPGEVMGRDQVTGVATHAAMPSVAMATFSSGNDVLNSVWKLCARSCLYCTHEQFVDTPTREKGQFVWDASNESEAVMRVYGDRNMTWQGLRDVQRGQGRFHPDGRVNAVYPNGDGARDIPTFTARYPEWLWRYYVATGDLDTAIILYPSLVRVADYLWAARNGVTGLLYGLADGFNGDPVYGYDLSVVADTASNVLAINAFTRTAQVADLSGDAAGAALARGRAAQLTASVNSILAAGPGGVYLDGLNSNGSLSGHASQEANALALAYNVVPPSNMAAVASYVAGLGVSVGPNHGLELLRGLAGSARFDDMVRLLTDASVPGWAHIVASGGTFTWETWAPSDLVGDSLSHGWGSSALVAMGESLLGLSLLPPSADGAVRVEIKPPPAAVGLTQARGSMPTAAGPVSLGWSRTAAVFTLDLTIPANAAATIAMPAASSTAVRERGSAIGSASGVTYGSFANGTAYLAVGSGTYQFTASLGTGA